MNRSFKTIAAKGVNNHYNEYKEFHQREIEAHVCASFMEMSGMKTFDSKHKIRYLNELILWSHHCLVPLFWFPYT